MTIRSITYAGHAAVFLSTQDSVIAVDPWLEGNPKCPDALKNPEKLDLIVLTHGHSDHASEAARLAKSHNAQVAAIYELAMIMVQEGVPQQNVIPMNKGGSCDWRDLRLTLTHALHSSSYESARGTLYAGEACGVILTDDRRSIYHTGDTALFTELQLLGEFYAPEVVLLPIGDHFTMGPLEAAKAVELLRCKTAIPLHYGTFDVLTGTVRAFQEACQAGNVKVVALMPGESHSLS